MRPLETLLLLANLLTFLTLAVPPLRAASWARVVAPIALLLAGAQVLADGPRWQMVPAYALNGLFVLVWLLRGRAPTADRGVRSPAGRIAARAGVVLALLGVAGSSALPIIIPVFHLPHPTGPYAIGTVTYHWVDSARAEVFTSDPEDRRELMVQVWYPGKGDRSAPRAPYVQDSRVLPPLAHLLRLPGFVLGHFEYVTTNAIASARVSDRESSYPVLIFSHGRGGFRQHNTQQVEELVSHGYIVAAIDHPYAAAGVVFPDGRLAEFDPRMFDPARPGHAAFVDTVLPFLAQDVSLTLDRLALLNQADPSGILTGRLDLQRAGFFGLSLGGLIGAEACHGDARLRACLFMDVSVPADVVKAGLWQPAMWISRDSGGMNREGWKQADIDETQATMRAAFESLHGDGYLVFVPGMYHANFSDAPLLSPLAKLAGITGPIDARRGRSIVNALELAFFDRYLKGLPSSLLDHPAEQYPEVLFESRRAGPDGH